MGHDVTNTQYHLTPRGWMALGFEVSNPPPDDPSPPEDRVETWIEKETTHDVYVSNPTRQWTFRWASPEWSEADRNELRANSRNKIVPKQHDPTRFSWNFPL